MKRREAIKQIGLGLSAGYMAPHMLSSCTEPTIEPAIRYNGKVAVIGAGIAGLYASSVLRSKGIDVTVIEASNQLGGRIRSLYNQQIRESNRLPLDTPIELGAEIIYGSDTIWSKNILTSSTLAVEAGVLSEGHFVVGDQVKPYPDWSANTAFTDSQNFVSNLKNYSGAPSTTIAEAVAGFSSEVQPLLNSQLGNFYGSSNDRIGMQGLAEAANLRKRDDKMMIMERHLMQDIVAARFSSLRSNIIYNSPIVSVQYDKNKVILTNEQKKALEFNKVIVTVPVSILKQNQITFNPALPSPMRSSIDKIGMDHSMRIVIGFKKNFWGDSTNFIWGMTSAPHCFSATVNRTGELDFLSITVNGPKAAELAKLGPSAVNEIISEMDKLHEGKASKYVNRDSSANQVLSYIQDWGKDEYIKGGYSYLPPSASNKDRVNLGAPIQDTLFFAGEATDTTGEAGFVNGALASSERVTGEVIKSILQE